MYQSAYGPVRLARRRLEPGMEVARVVQDEVDDDLDPSRVAGLDERVEVSERAVARVDVDVARDVVAEVEVR